MKNKKLKFKIALTNIRRIITSILFINIMPIFNKVVLAAEYPSNLKTTGMEVTCYAAGPQLKVAPAPTEDMNLFVILVPVAVVVILVIGLIVGIKKHRKKNMENRKNDKKD